MEKLSKLIKFSKKEIAQMKEKTIANYILKTEMQNFIFTPLTPMPISFAQVLIDNNIFTEIDDNGFCKWQDPNAVERWKKFVDNVRTRLFTTYEETVYQGKRSKKVLVYRNWFKARVLDIILTFINQRESFYKHKYSTWSDIKSIEIDGDLQTKIKEQKEYENELKNFYKRNQIGLDFRQELF